MINIFNVRYEVALLKKEDGKVVEADYKGYHRIDHWGNKCRNAVFPEVECKKTEVMGYAVFENGQLITTKRIFLTKFFKGAKPMISRLYVKNEPWFKRLLKFIIIILKKLKLCIVKKATNLQK